METYTKPNRKFLDVSFWFAHVAFISSIFLVSKSGSTDSIIMAGGTILLVLSGFSIFLYFFAIGLFAKKTGRSPIIWGGGSLIFSPISVWVTYIASFNIAKNPKI